MCLFEDTYVFPWARCKFLRFDRNRQNVENAYRGWKLVSAIPEFFVEPNNQLANVSEKNPESKFEDEEVEGGFAAVLQQTNNETEPEVEVENEPTDTGVEIEGVLVADSTLTVAPNVAAGLVFGPFAESLELGQNVVAEAIPANSVESVNSTSALADANEALAVIPTAQNSSTIAVQSDTKQALSETQIELPSQSTTQILDSVITETDQLVAELGNEFTASEDLTIQSLDSNTELNLPAQDTGTQVAKKVDGVIETSTNVEQNIVDHQIEQEIANDNFAEVDVLQEATSEVTTADADGLDATPLATTDERVFDTSKLSETAIDEVVGEATSKNQDELIKAVSELGGSETDVDVSTSEPPLQQLPAYSIVETQDPFQSVPEDVKEMLSNSVSRQTVAAIKESLANVKPPFVQSITVEIHPADLGKLNIQVEVVKDTVQATIVATENFSADLLSRNKSELVSALSEFGFGDANVDVSHHGSQSEQQNKRNFHSSEVAALEQATPTNSQTNHLVQVGVNMVA